MNYYIGSCLFTAKFPKLSQKIIEYMSQDKDIHIVRCCIPNYRVESNEKRIKDKNMLDIWRNLPVSQVFDKDDIIISICHNCTNIVEEWRSSKVISLWEYIDQDTSFKYPDHHGLTITLQDCWRVHDRLKEQKAVRSLLKKMNIHIIELEDNYDKTTFCGSTLYRQQPLKNARLAPHHYIENAKDYFKEYPRDIQIQKMKDYCQRYETDKVVCYCHYCLDGLLEGEVNAYHIAQLLFDNE